MLTLKSFLAEKFNWFLVASANLTGANEVHFTAMVLMCQAELPL